MAQAQANSSVYKRMTAKLGSADNGTGGINPNTNNPGGVYKRKNASDAKSSGGSNYNRKTAKSTKDGSNSVVKAPQGAPGPKAKFAD